MANANEAKNFIRTINESKLCVWLILFKWAHLFAENWIFLLLILVIQFYVHIRCKWVLKSNEIVILSLQSETPTLGNKLPAKDNSKCYSFVVVGYYEKRFLMFKIQHLSTNITIAHVLKWVHSTLHSFTPWNILTEK